jgi:hypothetical protein
VIVTSPVDPDFEALAQKLGAKHEPEPVIKGRRGVPEEAVEKLQEIAEKGPRAPFNPFGPNVEVSEDE